MALGERAEVWDAPQRRPLPSAPLSSIAPAWTSISLQSPSTQAHSRIRAQRTRSGTSCRRVDSGRLPYWCPTLPAAWGRLRRGPACGPRAAPRARLTAWPRAASVPSGRVPALLDMMLYIFAQYCHLRLILFIRRRQRGKFTDEGAWRRVARARAQVPRSAARSLRGRDRRY
jgi:hypothetical protein